MSAASMVPPAAAPASELRTTSLRESFGARFERFQQTVGGLPVLGAEVVVTDGAGRRADLVLDDRRPGLRKPPQASISKEQAIRLAARAARVRVLRAKPQARLAILPRPRTGRLVWRVVLPSREPLASFEVLVDARTGSTVAIRDALRSLTGLASLFDPNPVVQQGSRTGLADNGDADSTALTSLRVPVTLERLSGNCLAGQWVRATLPSGDVCKADRDWSAVTRSDDRFEALMAYFHLDRAQAYVQSLGFTNVMNRQLRMNVDDFPDDNSFYDTFTKEIYTGEGGVDDAEDAEVIDHEYGHAIQDDQVPDFGSPFNAVEARAMGEGFGDYFAAALAATLTPNPTFDACIGEWNEIVFGSDCLRRVDGTATATDLGPGTSCNAEEHCYGPAWSGALWALRGSIGGAVMDRLVIQSHFSLAQDSDFQEASRALLAADQQLYGGTHRQTLIDVLSSRALADPERFDDTPADAIPLAVPGSVSGRLDAGSDVHDVYRLDLQAGVGVIVRMSGEGNFDLRLLRPGTTSTGDPNAIVAGSTSAGSNESFEHIPASTGSYFLDVSAVSGSGAYLVETLRDTDADTRPDPSDNCPSKSNYGQEDRDKDGIGDACDNCPRRANRSQADWDGDGHGDRCDRSARIRIDRLTVRRGRVIVIGSFRPLGLAPKSWHLVVTRRTCKARRCRFRVARDVAARKRLDSGRVRVTVRLRPGRYRFRAVLRSSRYRHVRSRVLSRRVR